MTGDVLHTQRLTRRLPELKDFEHWAACFASERPEYLRGVRDRADSNGNADDVATVHDLRALS